MNKATGSLHSSPMRTRHVESLLVRETALAYAAARTMEALLAGVQPGDGITFAAAVALCLFMTIAGSLLPAVRAVRVDPSKVIRAE